MTPQTVNAYYNPVKNEIVFPAAILQPPFFDLAADDAVNYGAIGAVIGHEIGHGFDDQGRRFDGDGKLRDWWKPEDETEFQKRAKLLIEQFNAFSPLPGMNVNGELTLGENIGDLGGLSIAYKAYKISLAGKPAPVHRRVHGRSALLHGLGAGVAREGARRVSAPAGAGRPARVGGVPRERPARQHPGVLHGVRREARRQAVHRAGETRQDLVGLGQRSGTIENDGNDRER